MGVQYLPRKDFVMLRLSNRETNEMGIALPQRSSSSLQFRVEAVGDDVRNLSVGDRVIVYAKQGMGDYYELPTDSNLILLREEFSAARVVESEG